VDAIEIRRKRVVKQRNKREPEWFSLFGGPSSTCALAHRLKYGAIYEFMYRTWSGNVHASNGFSNFAGVSGNVATRPLRHPDGLQMIVK